MKNKILFLIVGMFLINLVSAGNLSIFPSPGMAYNNTNILYSFNFSNSTNCNAGNIILNWSGVVSINNRGFGYLEINISGLPSVPIKLCEYKDATYTLRKNHSFSDIIFNTIYARNLNLSENLIVLGNSSFNGTLMPRTTLTFDVGSGALRWGDLYVTDISADNADISEGITADNITTNCVAMAGSDLALGQCGANVRINITSAGNMYGMGPWDNDDIITASTGLIVRRSRALPYPYVKIYDYGIAVFDGTVGENLMINLTTAGNYIGVGNVTANWGFFNNLNLSENLNVLGNSSFNGTLMPRTSLAFDIGSGASRWRNIYVTNISADYVDIAYDLDVSGTIFADIINATSMNITTINVHTFNTTNINASYIYNPYFAGYADFRADPWYIGGTDLQIAENLIVDGNMSVKRINATDWTNVTIIESQISDLQAYLLNGTNVNLLAINATDWSNVTITESQISDLQSYLLNGTNVNLLAINASSATIHGNLNFTGLIYGNGSQLTGLTLTEADPLWSANLSNVAFTNIDETFDENLIVTKNFTVNSTDFFVNSNLGRVGIGTASPGAKLEVAGNIIVQNNGIIYPASTGDLNLRSGSAGHVKFWAEYAGTETRPNAKFEEDASGNTELLIAGSARITDTDANEYGKVRYISGGSPYFEIYSAQGDTVLGMAGNVGIGTSSPTNLLTLGATSSVISTDSADASDNKRLLLAGGGTPSATRGAYIDLHGNEYASDGGEIHMVAFNHDIYFNVGSGKVGIGTGSPNQKLEVIGDINISDAIPTLYFDDTNAEDAYIQVDGNRLGFWQNAVESLRVEDAQVQVIGAADFRVASPLFVVDVGLDAVGIGTATPTQKLHVEDGNIYVKGTGQTIIILDDSSAANRRLIMNASDSEVYIQHTYSTGSVPFHLRVANTDYISLDGVAGEVIINDDSIDLDFRVESNNDVNALFVQGSDGNVGIGTSSPNSALEIKDQGYLTFKVSDVDGGINFWEAGTVSSTEVQYGASIRYNEDSDRLEIITRHDNADKFGIAISRGSGDVGIGTATPSYKLDVAGDIHLTGLLRGTSYKIFVQPGTGYFDGLVGILTPTTPYTTVNKFEDGAFDVWVLNVQVPTGATGLTSIKIYYNGLNNTNLYLKFHTSRWDTDTAGTAVQIDTTDTYSTYAGQASGTGILTVPSESYNGLTFDEGDIVGLGIHRNALHASDTYNTNWEVTGIEFVFS